MLEAKALGKRYGAAEAVRNVSFMAEAGSVVGLLGPNGAGKTTIMKMLAGIHFPSSGDALVQGLSVTESPQEVKRLVGYLPETAPSYGEMEVGEFLAFTAAARGFSGKEVRRRVLRGAELCGLGEQLFQRIDTLSKGYRQRVGLAQAVLHDPPLLILDEPSSGLDPNQILEMRSLIRELGKSKTVLLSTHILSEVEELCSRVVIVHKGSVAAEGPTAEVAAGARGAIVVEASLRGLDKASLPGALRSVEGFRSLLDHSEADGVLSFSLELAEGSDAGERVFSWAASRGLRLRALAARKAKLEEAFAELTSEKEKP